VCERWTGTKPSAASSRDAKSTSAASADARTKAAASADASPLAPASADASPLAPASADASPLAPASADARSTTSQSDDDEEDDEDYYVPKVFQDPKTTYITRQLASKNGEMNPCDSYTVEEYFTSVQNNWQKYVGDVLHYRNPVSDIYFLVLEVQELTDDSKGKSKTQSCSHDTKDANWDEKCLMVRELTNNPQFVDVVIMLKSQDITNLIQGDEPEVIVYQAGSAYDLAHVPFGATVRMGIQDCGRWIDYAREHDKLVTWATRARGAGLYAESTEALRSKLMCTQQRDMAVPEIRELVASINIEKSIRAAMLARWLIPVANAEDASFTWFKAKTEVDSLETLISNAEMCEESFWYGPFLHKMRGAVKKYAEKVKLKNPERKVPVISDDNDEVDLLHKVCFDKTLTTEVGPFYICEAERIEEGFLLGTKTEGLPREGELVDVTKCNGICSNMNKQELEHYKLLELIERAKVDPAVHVPGHMLRTMRRMQHPDLPALLSRKDKPGGAAGGKRTRSPSPTPGKLAVQSHRLKKK
jgi:hypothetical protein